MTDALTIQVAPAERLDAGRRAELIAMLTAAYDEDFSRVFELLPGSTHVIGRVDGELTSHAAWVTRWLQPAGGPLLRTAYVESVATVATVAAGRRRGHAAAVLRELARHVHDFDLASLSPSDPAFYARLGWESWHGPLAIRTADGAAEATPGEEVMILRLPRTPPLDVHVALTAEWREGEAW